MENERDRIVGIKAIADYLDTSIRNVHRWEKELDLPLRRVGGKRGRSVYVYVEELEEWFKKQEFSNSNRKKEKKTHPIPVTIFAIALVAIVAIVLYLVIGKKTPKSKINPVMATYAENVIQIKNNKGDILWSYISYNPGSKQGWPGNKCVIFFDIDNDGLNEVIARTFHQADNRFYLTLFSHNGSELWKKDMENENRFNKYIDLKSDYTPIQVGMARSEENKLSIITQWRHHPRFLCIISSHDLDGKLLNKYSNVGHLGKFEICDIVGDKDPEIIFAGTNNLLNGEPIVGVLPLTGFKGMSPPYRIEHEFKDDEFRLKTYVPENPEPGNQLYYIRFKKTNHLDKFTTGQYWFAEIDGINAEILNISVYPWRRKGDAINFGFYYTMNHEFNITDLIANSIMSQLYPEILQNKDVDISLEELTSIYVQLVYKWENGAWVPVKNNFLNKTNN